MKIKLMITVCLCALLLSACGAKEDNSTLTDIENYMTSHGLLEGERIEPMAILIGAVKGFKYVESGVEVYEYDIKSDTYKTIVKTNKVTVEGYDMDMSASAINSKYVLFYQGQDDNVVEVFKEFDHRDAPIPEAKRKETIQVKQATDSKEIEPVFASSTSPDIELAKPTTPEPTPTSEPTPTPEPTKAPTPSPEPEEDYFDWVLYDTDNMELLLQNIIDGYVIYDGINYWCSPEYFEMIENAEVVYEHDVSEDGYYEDDYSVLDPDDAATLAERNYLDDFGELDPDVEYEIFYEEVDSYDEEALTEKINKMQKYGFASSESMDSEFGKAYMEFCDSWIGEYELKNSYLISVVQSISDYKLYLIIDTGNKYIIDAPSKLESGTIYTDGEIQYQYIDKIEFNGESKSLNQIYFNRDDLIKNGIIN